MWYEYGWSAFQITCLLKSYKWRIKTTKNICKIDLAMITRAWAAGCGISTRPLYFGDICQFATLGCDLRHGINPSVSLKDSGTRCRCKWEPWWRGGMMNDVSWKKASSIYHIIREPLQRCWLTAILPSNPSQSISTDLISSDFRPTFRQVNYR